MLLRRDRAGGSECGRPLIVDGQSLRSTPVAREDWCGAKTVFADYEPLPDHVRSMRAERWARDAALEHASVGSFARFTLDLLSVGAPAALVRAAQEAMRDEIDHAERCYALASRYGRSEIGPGPLPITGVTLGGGLLEVALRALVEGCVGETIAAITAQRTLETTREPQARQALEVIARDEAAHAELAFRFVAWAAHDRDVREQLSRALPEVMRRALPGLNPPASTVDDAMLLEHGQSSAALRYAAAREAVEQVIAPCLGALLGERADHERALSL